MLKHCFERIYFHYFMFIQNLLHFLNICFNYSSLNKLSIDCKNEIRCLSIISIIIILWYSSMKYDNWPFLKNTNFQKFLEFFMRTIGGTWCKLLKALLLALYIRLLCLGADTYTQSLNIIITAVYTT